MSRKVVEKRYNCPGCGLPFRWPRAMKVHWARKHPERRALLRSAPGKEEA